MRPAYHAELWGPDERKTLPSLLGGEYSHSFKSRVSAEKKAFAIRLRRNPTNTEADLWRRLRKRQIEGARFRRQVLVLGWIADFYCPEVRLVVEVDGASHDDKIESDRRRNLAMLRRGFSIVRVDATRVTGDLDALMADLGMAIRYCRTGKFR